MRITYIIHFTLLIMLMQSLPIIYFLVDIYFTGNFALYSYYTYISNSFQGIGHFYHISNHICTQKKRDHLDMVSFAIILFLSHNSSMYISAHLFVPVPLFTDVFYYFLYQQYYSYHFSTSDSINTFRFIVLPILDIISYLHFLSSRNSLCFG